MAEVKQLRLALVVAQHRETPFFDGLLAKELAKIPNVSLTHVFVLAGRHPTKSRVSATLSFRLIRYLECRLMKFIGKAPSAVCGRKQVSGLDHIVFQHISPRSDGESYGLRSKDADAVKEARADFLISTSEIWASQHLARLSAKGHLYVDLPGDGTANFSDVLRQEDSTSFRIELRHSESGKVSRVFGARIATAGVQFLNDYRLRVKATSFLAWSINRLQLGLTDSGATKNFRSDRIEPAQISSGEVRRYIYQTLCLLIRKVWRRFLGSQQRWRVVLGLYSRDFPVKIKNSFAIQNPPGRYLADPFLVEHAERRLLFAEDFDLRSGRGQISAYEVQRRKVTHLGVALKEDFHLSFPFVFPFGGDLFMVPETQEAECVRLYRASQDGSRFSYVATLLPSTRAVDTMIFCRDDKYWMLTNIDSSPLGEFESELHVFYADRFDSEDWTPHQLNPILCDSTRGRNGGLVTRGDEIFRVFQRQGFETYGAGIGLAKITKISPKEYLEEVVEADIIPIDGASGFHSFSVCDEFAATDAWGIGGR